MKTIKLILAPVLVAIYLVLTPLFIFNGCTTEQTALVTTPQGTVVVKAEQTLASARDTFTLFLKLDSENRAFVTTNMPQVHSFAEYLRAKVPCSPGAPTARFLCWLIQANDYKNQYKHGTGSIGQLQNALNMLLSNQDQAQNYINQIQHH